MIVEMKGRIGSSFGHFQVRILAPQPASPVSTIIGGRFWEIRAECRHSSDASGSPRLGFGFVVTILASVSDADFWYLCRRAGSVYRFRWRTWQLAAPIALSWVPQTRLSLTVQRSGYCAGRLGRAPVVEPSMLPTFNGW
jgi:hypothetical protein